MSLIDINVVLVRTLYESNIGATSRALSNMGIKNLILIDRKCKITYQAQQAAASGQSAFLNRKEYDSWDEFYAQEKAGLRIAFSARDGRERPCWDYKALLLKMKSENSATHSRPIYLIFGPEDVGLSNDDLAQVHYSCRLPTFGKNQSLNLSQAVLLATYIFKDNLHSETIDSLKQENESTNLFPDKLLENWLSELGFDLSKPLNAASVLKRMFLHNIPTEKELNIFEIVIQQNIRKLKEYNLLRKSNSLSFLKDLRADEISLTDR